MGGIRIWGKVQSGFLLFDCQEYPEDSRYRKYPVYSYMNSAVSILLLRIDTAELHRVCDSMLQRAQKCIDEQDHFQHIL
jgi:hypothetical protein